ncbi:PEP-utilizing enzyme [Melittangium boletus]|uniref:PEP-utilising enzyme mobile domain-containing protein n=1 Tax=Melittangium boletus DSM 14713 TaxID=1294270 RepID=A0A250ILQ3_9BACT|nr:PEP-utilizing enzyme [Melittangium boletus]ATB31876.1 hypothetical protein MEBOL_005347 [Melittangium boletus DSM 14713]
MENRSPSQVSFEAPGPGSWELETAHMKGPITPICANAITQGLRRGFSEATARYGLVMDHLRMIPVEGFMYAQTVYFGDAEGPLSPTHPDMLRRVNTAERALEGKWWREDLRRWDEEVKPAAIRTHHALQAVEPASLSTEELAEYLRAIGEHLRDMTRVHHAFNIAHIFPVGDFLVHATQWTGKSPGELARLLKGASAVSAQLATREPPALVQALREDAAARELLLSRTPARRILDELVAMPGAVGEQMKAHLQHVGYRSLGYDLSDPYVLEVPEALVRGIRGAVAGRAPEDDSAEARHLEQVREAVPAVHRALFDELLAEARLVYRLRDERNTYSDGWAMGLTRRAVLAVGTRLQELGRLTDATLAIEAELEELQGLLAGASAPTSEELRRRFQWRTTKSHVDVPARLGAPPSPSPSLDWLPPAARRVNTAVTFYLGRMMEEPPAQTTRTSVRGLPVSPGIHEGTARIIREQTDLGRIEAGDVLVAATTSPYFNVVLPLLGAIVTDRGGQLCHAAIVTREYGIPGIVGTRDATKLVRDGARVRVNGTTGELQVLA